MHVDNTQSNFQFLNYYMLWQINEQALFKKGLIYFEELVELPNVSEK